MKNSIVFSITFIFTLAGVSIFLAFWWLMDYDKQNYTKELNNKYSIVSQSTLYHLNNFITKEELNDQVKNYHMSEVSNEKIKNKIINSSNTLQEITAKIGTSAILEYNNLIFLKITYEDVIMLLKDNDYQPYRYIFIRISFASVFFILLITYIFTIRRIRPLRKLKEQIQTFALGEYEDFKPFKTNKNDEISQVATAFYNATEQIKALNQSRQLFLRNIMHELKTPITKGRITAEMIQKDKYQERLIGVFEKLEALINEFASIEQLTSKKGFLQKKTYKIADIVDEAIDLSMTHNYSLQKQRFLVNADFKLLSIAIKNMIDNGVKHSKDKQVQIKISKRFFCFSSKGERLKENLEHYLEPFTQEDDKKNHFGLGLYIVKNILNAHKLDIKYKHENNLNKFYFTNIKNIICENLQTN